MSLPARSGVHPRCAAGAKLECVDAASGEPRSVVCAVNRQGEEYFFVPLAKLFTGNPYDELSPPM